jgi:hypothetical protein
VDPVILSWFAALTAPLSPIGIGRLLDWAVAAHFRTVGLQQRCGAAYGYCFAYRAGT